MSKLTSKLSRRKSNVLNTEKPNAEKVAVETRDTNPIESTDSASEIHFEPGKKNISDQDLVPGKKSALLDALQRKMDQVALKHALPKARSTDKKRVFSVGIGASNNVEEVQHPEEQNSADEWGTVEKQVTVDKPVTAEEETSEEVRCFEARSYVEEPVSAEEQFDHNWTSELPGEEVETEEGPIWVRKVVYAKSQHHGREAVADFLMTGEGMATLAKDKSFATLNPHKALFFDTETTGLAGGTGTLAFLVGVGWINEAGNFVLEQYFCRHPGEERAQLLLFSKAIANCEYLVTFNGKSFDVPLINTRFVMNRMKNPGASKPHMDLLGVARRIFSRRLSNRSLTSLESAILGFDRVDDIPGYAIPPAYADYIRGGPEEPMAKVLEHNAYDLLALAALGGVLERIYNDPEAVEHVADHLGLAKAALHFGENKIADEHLSMAGSFATGDDKQDALHMKARTAARQKDFGTAASLWHEILESFPDDGLAHLSLAKYYEHKVKKFEKALYHASGAIDLEGVDGCEHRKNRLKRKQKKYEENNGERNKL